MFESIKENGIGVLFMIYMVATFISAPIGLYVAVKESSFFDAVMSIAIPLYGVMIGWIHFF